MQKNYVSNLLKTMGEEFDVYYQHKTTDLKKFRKLGAKDPSVTLAIHNDGEAYWKFNRVDSSVKIRGVLPESLAPFEMSISFGVPDNVPVALGIEIMIVFSVVVETAVSTVTGYVSKRSALLDTIEKHLNSLGKIN